MPITFTFSSQRKANYLTTSIECSFHSDKVEIHEIMEMRNLKDLPPEVHQWHMSFYT
uniref:Uncharacterized protein n=1 Tax=Rhizophora mucronata TaxID=61149 RepID=A0A2P2QZT2_RHIMU